MMENFMKRITKDVDLSFAILLSFCVYVFFAMNIEIFFSHNISFAILAMFFSFLKVQFFFHL